MCHCGPSLPGGAVLLKVGADDPYDAGESLCSYAGLEIGGPFLAPLPRELFLDWQLRHAVEGARYDFQQT